MPLSLKAASHARIIEYNASSRFRLAPNSSSVSDPDRCYPRLHEIVSDHRIDSVSGRAAEWGHGANEEPVFPGDSRGCPGILRGPPQQDMSTPQICADSSKGQTVKLAIVNYTVAANAKMLFEMNRQGMMNAKGSPKDEPGLGAPAFSASTKSTFEIFLLKGNATVQLTAASANDGTAIAATELDKLREVAKKAVGRM